MPSRGNTSVINGEEIAPSLFRASFYLEVNGSPICTATLIGRRVLLTAAHCVANGGKATIKIGMTSIDSVCTHHIAYLNGSGDPSADYALCVLDKMVYGRSPERLQQAPPQIAPEKLVFLIGYGCTRIDVTGGNNGKLTAGLAPVKLEIGGVKQLKIQGKTYDMRNSFATMSDPTAPPAGAPYTNAIICKGDSGGAVYELSAKKANGLPDPSGPRRVVAVNSRFGRSPDGLADGRSILSATGTPDFEAFLWQWQQARKADGKEVKICGRDERDANCNK